MNIELNDTMPRLSGKIVTHHIDRQSGLWQPIYANHNVVAYTAADLMAQMLAGNDAYRPQHIGFLYGTDPDPLLNDPDTLPVETRRIQDWSVITTETAAIHGNIVICPLALQPGVSLDGSSTYYTGNATVFAASTGLIAEYAYPTTGSTFAASLPDLEDYPLPVYFYQAILLSRFESKGVVTYTPFSRAMLQDEPFTPKPANFNIGVFWTITFK